MQQPALKNDQLDDRAAQIAKEYEDYAYIVSHDLNAPLRHVKQFTELLITARGSNLSEDEKEYTKFLETALQRLDDMQVALLSFSRLNTQSVPFQETDLNNVVEKALQKLGEVAQTSSAEIKYSNLPTINAEPQQMQTLFFNLIENALKFHDSADKKKEVAITATDQGQAWLFEVSDNGIGIAEDYHEEVFRLFRRLEPEKYSGIGAGLTISRKIVQYHGGEIYIKSEPGNGTSVFFSVNK